MNTHKKIWIDPNIGPKLKERFCKDCNLPITIFYEPYFSLKIELLDDYYDSINKWNLFVEEFDNYRMEQDYFEEYNRVKDEAITVIKESKDYQNFNMEDMNKYQVKHTNFSSKDIYKESNNNREFISIDMKKANFSSLYKYSPNIFQRKKTWEDFISQFTNNKHIINSKYIRQVVLGNCNPKRHITYEKYLMDTYLTTLEKNIPLDNVVFFSNDEIIFDITGLSNDEKQHYLFICDTVAKGMSFPLELEHFTLHKIENTQGYYKQFQDGTIKLKGLDSFTIPFVIRALKNQPIQSEDMIFYHNGLQAKLIEAPIIKINKHVIEETMDSLETDYSLLQITNEEKEIDI